MIVLDTNVLSALMRREPEAPVVARLDRQPADSIWNRLLADDLENRALDFDSAAAAAAASLAAERKKAGHPVDMRDTQIAGIAPARRTTLATRNVRHFADLQVPVTDP